MPGDEMAQLGGAASLKDTLAGGGVDRLAQLRRLIEQDQTLAAIVRGSRSEQHVELSLTREQPPSFLLAREDQAFAHHWQDEAQPALVDPADAPLEPPDDSEYDRPDYSNGLPDHRRGLKLFAALMGLALAGSASAFTYLALSDRRGRGAEVSVVAASISPDKTVPSPREPSRADERPADRPEERSVNSAVPMITGAEEPADAKPPITQPLPPISIDLGPAPTKVAGLISAPTPAGSSEGVAHSRPPDVKKPAPRRRARVAAAPSAPHAERYDVQLSSERSEAAAHIRSLVLQTAYPKVFAGRKPFIRRADLGDRGIYYRVQIGPFALEEANQICGDLKKSGADCVVQRN